MCGVCGGCGGCRDGCLGAAERLDLPAPDCGAFLDCICPSKQAREVIHTHPPAGHDIIFFSTELWCVVGKAVQLSWLPSDG